MMRLTSLFLVLACFLTGCSSEGKVNLLKGKIVKGGQPMTLKSKGPLPPGQKLLVVEFIPVSGGNGSEPVSVDDDNSSFTVVGASGKGVKAGKYKLAVTFTDPISNKDMLNGAFNAQNTKIVVTVEDGKADLGTIDLDNPPK